MQRLHVGSGTSRGALTVFPVWGEYSGTRGYSLDAAAAAVTEQPGPAVSTLTATNRGSRPLLVLEGQLLEGGWQNRVVGRSVLVPAGKPMDLDVYCVEAGRWGGADNHQSHGRRASLRVRGALRAQQDQQGEVWRRVGEYDARFGANATESFVEHANRGVGDVDRLVDGMQPLPGQVGVVLGIAGQPVLAEVFDSPATLASQFRSLLRAAALDALGLPEEVTPSRRARRFVDRLSRVERRAVAPAGAGTTLAGADAYATVSALTWRRRDVHLVATNPRHPLNLVGSN
jgi:hypothetical protein